ncbi:transposase [Amycolatopsis sp. FBCC-B4732]|uniref:transposase n=1 Tax=Amycolatopsis sp. FBCC-B4732 TaxID=3079339 RepID=UPI0037BE43A0
MIVCRQWVVVGRGGLTDKAWARIEALLPAETGRRGGRRSRRQVINAILWNERTGAPWRDLPERYGPGKTAHERLRSSPHSPFFRAPAASSPSTGMPRTFPRRTDDQTSPGR